MTFNVFYAAAQRELSRVVWAAREVDEFGSLLSSEPAGKALGFEPQHSWRDGS